MTNKKQPILIDAEPTIIRDVGDSTVIRKDQEITPDFIEKLKDQRFESTQRREGEFMRVASIPTILVEEWARQGFDIVNDRNISARQIVARLKAEGFDTFLTTNKNV